MPASPLVDSGVGGACIPPTASIEDRGAVLIAGNVSLSIGPTSQLKDKKRPFLVVGRQAATADIRIDHKSLSRQHAMLYYDEGGENRRSLWVQDLDTKKGTRVNGTAIAAKQAVRLRNGNTIQFGTAKPVFSVSWGEDDPKKELKSAGESDVKPELLSEADNAEDQGKQVVDDEEANVKDKKRIESAGAGLTGRAKRQAEIEAMMDSLDEAPIYKAYTPKELSEPSGSIPLQVSKESSTKPAVTSKEKSTAKKHKIPIHDMLTMEHTEGTITCMVWDPTGARFAVGSTDTSVRFYDFGGFTATVNDSLRATPFAAVLVQEGYRVVDGCYSPNGDRIIVGTGSQQPKVLDRDGQEIIQFVRGDVYVTDPTKTMGHTAAVSGVSWHPMERDTVATSSLDGSVRLWDLKSGKMQFQMLTCRKVVRITSSGRKTAATCLQYAPGGREIAVGTAGGDVQIYNFDKSILRPQRAVETTPVSAKRQAIDESVSIASIVYSFDGTYVASCSVGGRCCVWQASRMTRSSQPLVECSRGSMADYSRGHSAVMAFSPDGSILCVGCTVADDSSERKTKSFLCFYAIPSSPEGGAMTPILKCPLPLEAHDKKGGSMGGIVSVVWHPKLNQILVAHSHAGMCILFSSHYSKRGALLAVGTSRRKAKAGGEDDLQQLYQSRAPPPGLAAQLKGDIITPNSLPLFSNTRHDDLARATGLSGRRKRKGEENIDESQRRKPAPPTLMSNNTGTTTFTQFIVDATGKQKALAGQDPRAALFQYNEGKTYIGDAYKDNKERILTETTVEEEEDAMEETR